MVTAGGLRGVGLGAALGAAPPGVGRPGSTSSAVGRRVAGRPTTGSAPYATINPRTACPISPWSPTTDETSPFPHSRRPPQQVLSAATRPTGTKRPDGWLALDPGTDLRRGPRDPSPAHSFLYRPGNGARRWSEHGLLRGAFGYRRSDGRGKPVVRGAITGGGTFLGGVFHTLPFLISDYRIALMLAVRSCPSSSSSWPGCDGSSSTPTSSARSSQSPLAGRSSPVSVQRSGSRQVGSEWRPPTALKTR
jgi:hypothetical protein